MHTNPTYSYKTCPTLFYLILKKKIVIICLKNKLTHKTVKIYQGQDLVTDFRVSLGGMLYLNITS